jgi:hypothetical protein
MLLRMQRSLFLVTILLSAVAGCASGQRGDHGAGATTPIALSFDDLSPGGLPAGWSIAGTRQGSGPLAAWSVTRDRTAPSQPNALTLTASPHGQDQTYNLCWSEAIRFRDGRISVKFKSIAGEVDQGGGPIWRAQDADNYYICRANPLESNFRVYKVVNGTRKQLATAAVEVATNAWHTINVEHVGARIVCIFNGTTRLEVTDDELPDAGGVGVWTKADALTAFDDVRISPGTN